MGRRELGRKAVAILECDGLDNLYFVFTHRHDELEDPPYSLSLGEAWRARAALKVDPHPCHGAICVPNPTE